MPFLTGFIPEGELKDRMRLFYYNNFRFKNIFYINHYNYKDNYCEIKFKNGVLLKFHTHPSMKMPSFLKSLIEDINHIIKGYLLNYQLENGDIVVDAGAYIGSFALYAAKIVGEAGKVIAFEPNHFVCQQLKENIKLNNLPNIIVSEKGLWNENKTLKFNNTTAGDSSFVLVPGQEHLVTEVQAVRLDDELAKLGIDKVNFIKMDIEGAEIEAIEGSQDILKNNNINLAIASYHIIDGQKTSIQLEPLFSRLGYKTITGFLEHQTTYVFKK